MVDPGYILSKDAEADLIEIARYTIRQYGREQQLAYIKGLYRFFEQIAYLPRFDTGRLAQRPSVLARIYRGNHYVLFRMNGETAEISRIIHTSCAPKTIQEMLG